MKTITVHTDKAVTPCSTVDPEIFFPARNEYAKLLHAQSLCRTCPQQIACFQFALDTQQQHGVWGGRKFGEAVTERPKKVPLDEHGLPIGVDMSRFVAKSCRSGHEYTPANTGWYEHGGAVERYCKTCRRVNKARSRALLAA